MHLCVDFLTGAYYKNSQNPYTGYHIKYKRWTQKLKEISNSNIKFINPFK
jgi:hypothetical protein